uniref:Uncharacterized protein n=1 Tax=Aegilops tauschii subsp. strangulata TaxID=200361 RepID=A0A453H3B8_AEGTS
PSHPKKTQGACASCPRGARAHGVRARLLPAPAAGRRPPPPPAAAAAPARLPPAEAAAPAARPLRRRAEGRGAPAGRGG